MPAPRKITAFGETRSITEWALIRGLDRCTLNTRLKRLGWDAERALSTPIKIGWADREDHGMAKSPEYRTWQGMKDRCANPKNCHFHRYGGRGIEVCERWNSFAAFFEDMGRRPSAKHSIERLNNDMGYSPTNCVWATSDTQRWNTGRNLCVEYRGKKLNMIELFEFASSHVTRQRLASRIRNGWDVERALHAPIRKQTSRSKDARAVVSEVSQRSVA